MPEPYPDSPTSRRSTWRNLSDCLRHPFRVRGHISQRYTPVGIARQEQTRQARDARVDPREPRGVAELVLRDRARVAEDAHELGAVPRSHEGLNFAPGEGHELGLGERR